MGELNIGLTLILKCVVHVLSLVLLVSGNVLSACIKNYIYSVHKYCNSLMT